MQITITKDTHSEDKLIPRIFPLTPKNYLKTIHLGVMSEIYKAF